jgi:hypothetical protein
MGLLNYILTRYRRSRHTVGKISLTPVIVEPSFVDEELVEAMKAFLEEERHEVGCVTCHAELIVYGRRSGKCTHQEEGNK